MYGAQEVYAIIKSDRTFTSRAGKYQNINIPLKAIDCKLICTEGDRRRGAPSPGGARSSQRLTNGRGFPQGAWGSLTSRGTIHEIACPLFLHILP